MKKIFLLLTLLCTSLALSAGPIGEARARKIAEEFFAQHGTRAAVGDITLNWAGDSIGEPISTGTQLDNALMYIYSRGTNDGFVVVAGDSNVSPIIAYSLDNAIDTGNMAEATRDILEGWCKQINAARKELIPATSTQSLTRSNDQLYYGSALWDQQEPYNREAPVYEGYKCITGCVATAMSIICYHNRWPSNGVGTTPEYSYEDGRGITRVVPANTLGRTYDYDNMLFDYSDGFTDEQGNAVAALMKDMGTAVKMMYYSNEGGESGAFDINVVPALCTYFGYSKQAQLTRRNSYEIEEWNELMRTNLRECGPMYYSGGNGIGGHAFVIDGYMGNDYFSINFGWGGVSNGWYQLPYIEYYLNQLAIVGLTPDRDNSSTYRDMLYLYTHYGDNYEFVARGIQSNATKYEQGGTYSFVIGGVLNQGARQFNGVVAVAHLDKNNAIKNIISTYNFEGVDISHYYYWSDTLTITESIESGDTIRVIYKSYDSDEWQIARRYSEVDRDRILLMATPKEVAKELSFHYDKAQQVLYLESPNALQAELHQPNGDVEYQEMIGHSYIYYIPYQKGEYQLNVCSGGEPYILKLKF